MEPYECDWAINRAQQKIAELQKELAELEDFSAEVNKAHGEFESQASSSKSQAIAMQGIANSKSAIGMGECLQAALEQSWQATTGFESIKAATSNAIQNVLNEIAQQRSTISYYEALKARIIAEKAAREAAEAAARAAANSWNS